MALTGPMVSYKFFKILLSTMIDKPCYPPVFINHKQNKWITRFVLQRILRACLGQRVMEGIEGAIIPHYSKLSSRGF
jgi:hypothetical protein